VIPGILLFLLKFVLIGRIYWVLLILLRTVRQEMFQRIESHAGEAAVVPGRLKVVDPGGDPGAHPGQIFTLQPETTLGAKPGADLILGDPYISGKHARLRWDGVGWWIEDLGSRNGTFLNGSQVPPNTPQSVSPGAWIQVGGMSLTLLEE
jgi:hypothetical protein